MTPSDEPRGGETELPREEAYGPREKLVRGMLASLKNVNLYAPDHPACRRSLDEFFEGASESLAGKERTVLGLLGQDVVIDGEPLQRQAFAYDRLAAVFGRLKFDKLTLEKGVERGELGSLVIALAGASADGPADFNKALREAGVSRIRAGRLEVEREDRSQHELKGLAAAERDYAAGLEAARELNFQARRGGRIKVEEVSSVAKMMVRGVMENRGSLMTILNLHSKDEYTATHCLDVAVLTLLQVERFSLGEAALSEIACAAMLHDMGKMMVPDSVLNKRGPLTDEEWTVMRMHPTWGAQMVSGLAGVGEAAVLAAFEHHERWDLSGYPKRRRAVPMSMLGAMVAVSDAYDAMRSLRPYQEELPPDKAAGILLKGAGTSFSPQLADLFLRRVGIWGVGGLVRLAGGELAVVESGKPSDPAHPLVRLLEDEAGRALGGRLLDTSLARVEVAASVPMEERYRDMLMEIPRPPR